MNFNVRLSHSSSSANSPHLPNSAAKARSKEPEKKVHFEEHPASEPVAGTTKRGLTNIGRKLTGVGSVGGQRPRSHSETPSSANPSREGVLRRKTTSDAAAGTTRVAARGMTLQGENAPKTRSKLGPVYQPLASSIPEVAGEGPAGADLKPQDPSLKGKKGRLRAFTTGAQKAGGAVLKNLKNLQSHANPGRARGQSVPSPLLEGADAPAPSSPPSLRKRAISAPVKAFSSAATKVADGAKTVGSASAASSKAAIGKLAGWAKGKKTPLKAKEETSASTVSANAAAASEKLAQEVAGKIAHLKSQWVQWAQGALLGDEAKSSVFKDTEALLQFCKDNNISEGLDDLHDCVALKRALDQLEQEEGIDLGLALNDQYEATLTQLAQALEKDMDQQAVFKQAHVFADQVSALENLLKDNGFWDKAVLRDSDRLQIYQALKPLSEVFERVKTEVPSPKMTLIGLLKQKGLDLREEAQNATLAHYLLEGIQQSPELSQRTLNQEARAYLDFNNYFVASAQFLKAVVQKAHFSGLESAFTLGAY